MKASEEFWEKWDQLGDTPINEDEEIEVDFLHFEANTDIYTIWAWFEQTFDVTLGELLYNKRIR
jgi:hypothetical protein